MKISVPIYVINLKRNPERRLFIQRQLDAFGLEYSFVNVDDIDKYELESKTYRTRIAQSLGIGESILEGKYTATFDYVKARYKKAEYEKQKNDYLGQLAIMLSHIKIYDLIIKNDIDTACILEDDPTLLPTFPEILQTAAKLEWDILLLASLPTGFPLDLIQQKRIKYIRVFDKDLLFFSSKKKDCRIKSLLEYYGFSPRLYPKLSEIFEKVLQEYDTKYLGIAETLIPANRRLSWVKHEQYIKYRALRSLLREYTLSQLGALPEKSSLDLITDHHYIAKPKHEPFLTMAYLVKQSTAMKWKHKVLDKNHLVIDEVPWELYRNEKVKLRLITPPCAIGTYNYIIYSARRR